MYDRVTNRSRGFGFVTFELESVVDDVLATEHEIHGKIVEVKRAEPRVKYGGPEPTTSTQGMMSRMGPRGMGMGGRDNYMGAAYGGGYGGGPVSSSSFSYHNSKTHRVLTVLAVGTGLWVCTACMEV